MKCRRCGEETKEWNRRKELCDKCFVEGVLMSEMGMKKEFEKECETGAFKDEPPSLSR